VLHLICSSSSSTQATETDQAGKMVQQAAKEAIPLMTPWKGLFSCQKFWQNTTVAFSLLFGN
jgi:hypothetical protein